VTNIATIPGDGDFSVEGFCSIADFNGTDQPRFAGSGGWISDARRSIVLLGAAIQFAAGVEGECGSVSTGTASVDEW